MLTPRHWEMIGRMSDGIRRRCTAGYFSVAVVWGVENMGISIQWTNVAGRAEYGHDLLVDALDRLLHLPRHTRTATIDEMAASIGEDFDKAIRKQLAAKHTATGAAL